MANCRETATAHVPRCSSFSLCRRSTNWVPVVEYQYRYARVWNAPDDAGDQST